MRSAARRRVVHHLVRSPGDARKLATQQNGRGTARRADGAADCRARGHQGDSRRFDQPVGQRLPHHGQGREPRWQRAVDAVRELAHDQRRRRAQGGGRRGLRHPHGARRHRLAPGSAGRFRERDDQLPRSASELHRRPGALRHRQVRRGRDGVQAFDSDRTRTSAAPMRAWPTRCSSWGARPRRKSNWKKALSLMDRMTEREKYRTQGTYFFAVARNYEKAIDNYETLIKQYPTDSSGSEQPGHCLFHGPELSEGAGNGQAGAAAVSEERAVPEQPRALRDVRRGFRHGDARIRAAPEGSRRPSLLQDLPAAGNRRDR